MYTPTDIQRILQAMRDELTFVGVKELKTVDDVEAAFQPPQGTALLVVNSVCGCAAGNARPGVALALQNKIIPDALYTVFAGQDPQATARARSLMPDQPPSSPSVFLFKDGLLVYTMHRHMIEGRDARRVAFDLIGAFNAHCAHHGPSVPPEIFAQSPSVHVCGSQIPTTA
ncbi:MAG: BrxA/BrxB family bacilliredoxin [candidate division Zixibacteria bacterium]|nr:BrxA/BrxB family bacilliredoxin [candidate division Zixibacteria bacterium]